MPESSLKETKASHDELEIIQSFILFHTRDIMNILKRKMFLYQHIFIVFLLLDPSTQKAGTDFSLSCGSFPFTISLV